MHAHSVKKLPEIVPPYTERRQLMSRYTKYQLLYEVYIDALNY